MVVKMENDNIIKIENEVRYMFLKDSEKSGYHANQLKGNLSVLRFRKQIMECAKLIPPNSSVLEVGCGCGYVLVMLSKIRPDIKIVGSDPYPCKSWDFLRKLGYNLIKDDATCSSFSESHFDVVVSFGVMEHSDNDNAFMKETSRILKQGGLNLMFNLPNKYALNDFLARLFKLGGHKNRYTRIKIKKLFKNYKFRIFEIKKEYFIPAQIIKISPSINFFFNKYYSFIHKIDFFLTISPLRIFAQVYKIKSINLK
jgi:ubiquinone/menaquinone biosynthesis C-methylase UbiE